MTDWSRNNLIMHFECTECGNRLNISSKINEPDHYSSLTENPKLETGANNHVTPVVGIYPCNNCIEKYTKPAEKLVEALRLINEVDKK